MRLLANNKDTHKKYITDVMIYLKELARIRAEFKADPLSTSEYGYTDDNGDDVITRPNILNSSIIERAVGAKTLYDSQGVPFIAIYHKNLRYRED